LIDTDSVEHVTPGQLNRTNSVLVIEVPYFDDINVNDVHTTLEGLISEVETRPKATPVS
jgi:hypothetical protein